MENFFDGYCPESLLKGKHIEMRLNEDDFWESEATGLQISVFPPYATILRWRGSGKFRQSSDVASNSLVGLVLAEACAEDGKEIFPDEENIIERDLDLLCYLGEIYSTKEAFNAAKFNVKDTCFELQNEHLLTIPKEEFQHLAGLFDKLMLSGENGRLMGSDLFVALFKRLYELKIIFDFKWMDWDEGWKNIKNRNYDYSRCTLLELSMYLTAIFRADRFSEGTIEENIENGTLQKIFNAIKVVSAV